MRMATTVRTVYEIKEVMMGATTVRRLIDALKEFPQDATIEYCKGPGPTCWEEGHDCAPEENGYTLVFEVKQTYEQGEL